MDGDGMGDAAHQRDEIGSGQIGTDHCGLAGPVEEFGAGRCQRLPELRGAWEGVGRCGGDQGQGGVGDLRVEGPRQEAFECAPGIRIGQCLFAVGGQGFQAGVATVSSSASGVAKCR